VGLHQRLRELRASARRRVAAERAGNASRAEVVHRRAGTAAQECAGRRTGDLERLFLALSAHDPDRTLERGYALVEDLDGELITTAAAARRAEDVRLRFADGRVPARISPS
jgi:exodeoxyribonuclease VII large subunit